MSTPRLAAIPFEHVEAEMAAFPLASEASFHLGISELNPLISREDKLWRAAEQHILHALPSLPHDEAVIIRDKLWFESSNPNQSISASVPLIVYLQRLAKSYLDEHGRPIQIVDSGYDTSEQVRPEARLRWGWMCRALPPDLLRTVRGVVNPDADPFPLNPVIQQMLRDQGFAETHLHLGAALDFSLGWAALMAALVRSESRHDDFVSPGACFIDGQYLGPWLLHAAVVRLILAEWLFDGSSSGTSLRDLFNFAFGQPGVRGNDVKDSTSDRRRPANEPGRWRLDAVERARFINLLSELRHGRWTDYRASRLGTRSQEHLDSRFALTRALYRRLIRPPNLIGNREADIDAIGRIKKPEDRHSVFANDPLARVVGWHPSDGLSAETLFIRAALRRIEQDNGRDSDFAGLFWQVMRIRCLLYRHVVQRPLTPGLQWFVRFFSRIKPLRKISESILVNTAARLCGRDVGLRSLEVRLGTEPGESACLDKIRQVEKAARPDKAKKDFRYFRPRQHKERGKGNGQVDVATLEIGALFHFSRKRGGGWEQGNLNAYGLDHSYPGRSRARAKPLKDAENPTGFRFARFYMEQRGHAQALVSIFQKYPHVLRTVRGVDLCTDEAGVPVWVMAPLIRWVREAGLQAVIQLRRRGEFAIPPLRTSVHAGEDFIHLLTGLRRLDESVTYLRLEEGDRLGHALALGADPAVWSGRVGRVIQNREERLLDLVWEWSCYAKHGIAVASERLAYVRTEIVRLARLIFGWSFAPEHLMDFVDLLHKEQMLRIEGFPDKPIRRELNAERQAERSASEEGEGTLGGQLLLRSYLSDKRVWRKGRIPEVIDLRGLKHEQAALNQLQDGLRCKVGRLCLTIEVNPSSNLLVGDLGNLVGHPLWRLKPTVKTDNAPPLSVCIGSDDPLTFATTLPHEYQLLFDAMILMGHSHEEAMRWIDAARDTGMQSRFTLPPDVARLSQRLETPNLLGWQRPMSPP
jgi:hypothetical protein